MTVNFNPAIVSFKSSATSVNGHTCPECGQNIKQKNNGVINKTKNGYVNFRKFFIELGNMTGGVLKGLFDGAILGGITAGGIAIRNVFKKAPKKLGTKGKIIAGLVAAATLTVDIVKARLKSNKEKAALDHSWKTGHNE